MYKRCFLGWLNGLNGGSSRDQDHSFVTDQPVTWLFPGPHLYFHKAPCVNALSPGRPPHLVDANALGQPFALSISQSRNWPPTFPIYGSVEVCFFYLHHVFTFPALCSCLPPGSQYITCKLQNCSDGNRGKPFPGFIIPNSLVVQDEYVFIQVGFICALPPGLASLKDN